MLLAGFVFGLARYVKTNKAVLTVGIVIVLGILIILKTPFLLLQLSISLRYLAAQSTFLARKADLEWLGFSYLAFRIMHVFIDRRQGRLQDLALRDYFIYTIFYPTILAGPIDRFQRFQSDFENITPIKPAETLTFSKRLFMGLVKKYILADSLALFALSAVNASQVVHSSWLWLMTLAYSFQLYLDFAGYTDIAIAAAGYLGFHIPENFHQPYLQPNITKFWNTWHITLTQWIRAYYFNPLTRYFKSKTKLPAVTVIFIAQMSTMLIIGLWHGIAMNFFIWGAWHGLGLFIHNRWTNRFGNPFRTWLMDRPKLSVLNTVLSTATTFIFVSVGWVWFTIPNVGSAWDVLLKLFFVR
jgi:alginate O-acetyltransferase complex protein AlgI